MKIGIIGAITEEISSLKNLMLVKEQKEIAARTFYSGAINGIDTVLVLAKIGKVAAAITSTILIKEFAVDGIIFTGVAGAISNDLNIGDIVISNTLVQHDMDASPLFPKYQIPLLGISEIAASAALNKQLNIAINTFLEKSLCAEIDKNTLASFGIISPKLHTGTIVSGDQFVKSTDTTARIRNEIPDVKCVEMEGAAVAQVCHEFNIPFSIVRIISDKADHSASIDFNSFLKIAGTYSNGIIKNLFRPDLIL